MKQAMDILNSTERGRDFLRKMSEEAKDDEEEDKKKEEEEKKEAHVATALQALAQAVSL